MSAAVSTVLRFLNATAADDGLRPVTLADLAAPGFLTDLLGCARADRALALETSGWVETTESEESSELLHALLALGAR